MPRRDDERSIKRRGPTRQPKHRILVVCEGKKTEPLYFKHFQHHVRNQRVHVEPIGPAGVPMSVVETAIELRAEAERDAKREHDDNLLWDQVWAVFDIDDHPNVDRAKELAKSRGISLAISNPCFELWALLHFADTRRHTERTKLREELKKYLPDYEKQLAFERLHRTYSEAVQRARALDEEATHLDDHGRNPTTYVYLLTEMIRRS
jgi:hypothetical protein